jgi:hypothetical protein
MMRIAMVGCGHVANEDIEGNLKMNIKGKRTFSPDQFDRIRNVVRELRRAHKDEQKRLRGKLRSAGFYISDFVSGPSGMSEGELLELVQSGQISISKQASP